MKKIILIIILLFSLTGCTNDKNVSEYRVVADKVVGLYSNQKYDKKGLNTWQKNLVDSYSKKLNHIDEIIDLEQFIVREDSYKTTAPNSNGVFMKDGKCSIYYHDINMKMSDFPQFQGEAILNCNGYEFSILSSSIDTSYDDLVKDPQHNYYYLGYNIDTDYYFYYRSYYNGMGMTVKVNQDEVTATFETTPDIELQKEKQPTKFNFVFYIVVGGIAILLYLAYKKYRQNNDI